MSKINVLDSVIFNRIAAGEVVENPRSIVKELVENAIDAGADSITVEIRGGGIDYICVSDNGSGIAREDMPVAFMPHATSKIRSLKDLEAISTLGFRGEALPSIASVADVEMISRTRESELGYKITLSDGAITDEGECGASCGTKVTVRNLFAKIPARAKFLRKVQSEESSVTEFIIKIILSKPYLKFKYIADGETVYLSDGTGVQSAIYSVYGSEFSNNMAEISYAAPGLSLSGYICRPDYTKHSRNYQTLIVNGRYIVNADISYCIQQCYQNYLMKRQFPAYVLYLDLPADMVDVNVHPNKLDVRFSGEKRLKGVIYNAIKEKVDFMATEPIEFVSQASPTFEPIVEQKTNVEKSSVLVEEKPSINIKSMFWGKPMVAESGRVSAKLNDFVRSVEYCAAKEPIVSPVSNTQTNTETTLAEFDLFGGENVACVGKLFNTYLIAECGDDFYLIDQHAAHEKLLYDKLAEQFESGELAVQDLLVPYIFEVSPSEKVALSETLPKLSEFGFKIDALSGNAFSLYALPVCCSDIDLKHFMAVLLSDMEIGKRGFDFVKEKLMQAACKSAVKGEDDLAKSEIDKLLAQMRKADLTRFCPHGRPIIIKFSKHDLEKLFKRS